MPITKMRVRAAAMVVVAVLAAEGTGLARVPSNKAAYAGGTERAFPGATAPIAGRIDTADPYLLAFTATDEGFAGRTVSIPYARITRLEFGQKLGRRAGAAIGYTVLVGPAGLLALLSKNRHHYVTVNYEGHDGIEQAAVFEVARDIVRPTLAVLEARSSRRVMYQGGAARAIGSW